MLKQQIDQFLSNRQMAFAGLSRDRSKFGSKVYEKLKSLGYELYPIHPEMEACARSVSELPSPVRALMLVAGPDVCVKVLGDVLGSGIESVWVFTDKASEQKIAGSVERLREGGVVVTANQCPFMFLEPVDSVHAVHLFFARLLGRYPA